MMDRPGSRGSLAGLAATGISKAPTGSPIERPERPNTASSAGRPAPGQLQQQNAGSRGSTAVGAPPGTAYKRAGVLAAAGGPARVPAVASEGARPMTQMGVGGLVKPPGTAAGGRQVLDRNYFVSQLRQKRQEIVNATQQLQEEEAELQQRQTAAARAARRAGELQGEVRALQEALADANIVLDKVGAADLDLSGLQYDATANRMQLQPCLNRWCSDPP
jgi:intraflagellar transport protein 74